MRDTLMLASAIAMALGPMAAAPSMAQPADMMARPVPQPIRPLPQPLPNRPGDWNNGNNGNWNGGNNGNWNGGNWNGQIVRCESRNNRRNYCQADTRGGVRLVRQLSNTRCRENRTWGTSGNRIWVDNGCRGEFQLRHGSGQNSGGGGPSAGAIIGGVAIAGGLIALLAQSGNNKAPPANTTGNVAGPPLANAPIAPPLHTAGPAKITANMGGVTPDARPSLQTCLNEASRQIGATGGTEIKLDRLDDIQPGNGGFRFRFQLQAIYPDETRTIPTFCRATPTKVIELTFG